MKAIGVEYGDNWNTTGIADLTNRPDLAVKPGQGSITFTAGSDRHVKVFNVNGVTAKSIFIKAGETKSVSIPSGVYIINGVKIIVK